MPSPQAGAVLGRREMAGVDMTATVAFRVERGEVDSILDLLSRCGFIVMSTTSIPQRVTVVVQKPINASEATRLVNDLLAPLGYVGAIRPAESVKGTILQLMSLGSSKFYNRTGLLGDGRMSEVAQEGKSKAPRTPLDVLLPNLLESPDQYEVRMGAVRALEKAEP